MVRVGRVDDATGPEAWFKALPIVTRYWFASAFITTVSTNLGVINVRNILFLWEPLKDNFEVWRLLTPFLYLGSFNIQTVISLYFLAEYSKRYESGSGYNTGAGGGTADYVFALLFAIATTLISYPLVSGFIMPIFGTNLTWFVLYIWTKRYPTAQVSIWGFPIAALWLPFALLALRILMGGSGADMIHGFSIGHMYYFLVDVVPLVYGKDILHTPQFLIDYFGIGLYVPQAATVPPQQPARANTGGAATWNTPGRVNAPNEPNEMRRRGGNSSNTSGGGYNWGGSGRVLGSS